MTTWTTVSTSSTSWTTVPETAQGYIETEDNLFLIVTFHLDIDHIPLLNHPWYLMQILKGEEFFDLNRNLSNYLHFHR